MSGKPNKRPEIKQPDDLSICHIPLTQGQVAIVDAEDYARIAGKTWFAQWAPNTRSYYAIRCPRASDGESKRIRMANEIMRCPEGTFADHIKSGDTLNNRRSNLRVVNHLGNMQNKRVYSSNTSGFTGVNFIPELGRWLARLWFNGKCFRLGYYDTPEAGAAARRAKSLELRGF